MLVTGVLWLPTLQHPCLAAAIVAVYWEQLFAWQAHFPLYKGVGFWQVVHVCLRTPVSEFSSISECMKFWQLTAGSVQLHMYA